MVDLYLNLLQDSQVVKKIKDDLARNYGAFFFIYLIAANCCIAHEIITWFEIFYCLDVGGN